MTPLTTSQKLQALTEVIVKAVPSIKEERYREGCQKGSTVCGKRSEKGTFYCNVCARWGGEDRYELVFRDIRLADVLLALELKFKKNEYIRKFRPLLGPTDQEKEAKTRWNLRKDSLTEQSDETIDFLHSLLPSSL